jgi:ribosomal protein L32
MEDEKLVGVKMIRKMDVGVFYVPYVPLIITPVGDSTYRDSYNEFMDNYNLEHKYCPKCGHDKCSTTFAGFILYSEDRESYVDENDCVCQECGDKHIKHDRINEAMVQRMQ